MANTAFIIEYIIIGTNEWINECNEWNILPEVITSKISGWI